MQILIDASDANTANVMRGSATAVTQVFSSELTTGISADADQSQSAAYGLIPGKMTQNKYTRTSMLVVGLALFPPLLAALAMSREGEQKTILQVYVSSITRDILGKILAYMAIALVEWFLCICSSTSCLI